jgi:hypothetical protein
LPAMPRLDRHRGLAASRWRRTFGPSPRPKAWSVRQVFRIPVPDRFSDNTT